MPAASERAFAGLGVTDVHTSGHAGDQFVEWNRRRLGVGGREKLVVSYQAFSTRAAGGEKYIDESESMQLLRTPGHEYLAAHLVAVAPFPLEHGHAQSAACQHGREARPSDSTPDDHDI